MEKDKVSIIVPVYKVEQYLEPCVKSIINQSYKNLEIILVDDGSPDTCPQLCDKLRETDERIKVIHKKNGGLSDARNYGLEDCTGDYVLYVDSDDIIAHDMVEKLVSLVHGNNAEIAVSTFRFSNGDDSSKLRLSNQIICGNTIDILSIIYENGLWQAWAKLIKADIAKSNLFQKGLIYEDYDNTPRIFLAAQKAVISMDGRYIYTVRDNSIMGERKVTYSTDFIDITERNWEIFRNSKISEKNKMLLQKHLLANLVSMYNTIIKEHTQNYNTKFMVQSRLLIKHHVKEWFGNTDISITKKIAYVLLGYIPSVYNLILKYV